MLDFNLKTLGSQAKPLALDYASFRPKTIKKAQKTKILSSLGGGFIP